MPSFIFSLRIFAAGSVNGERIEYAPTIDRVPAVGEINTSQINT